MKFHFPKRDRGIALIIVLVVIVVLSIMAAGLAYSMKVETTLARYGSQEKDMEWLGRSGVELARYVLGQQSMITCEPYDALHQKWAGGPGSLCASNSVLAEISLENYPLGPGKFTVKITDLERKMNINAADRLVLQQALRLFGVEGADSDAVLDGIEDWRDRDTAPRLAGVESDYYLGLLRPYLAKDGPTDDVSELLLVRGITPDMFWGAGKTNRAEQIRRAAPADGAAVSDAPAGFGLVDVFNTLGRLQINLNTAPKEVLQLIPGIDESCAAEIVDLRDGLDNVDGTEDDTPFHSPRELNVSCMTPQLIQQIQRFCGVRSFTFEVRVDVQVDQYKRRLVALLLRSGPRNVNVIEMHWE